MKGLVLIGAEHVLAYVLKGDVALEAVHGIKHREYVSCGLRDDFHEFSEAVIDLHRGEVGLYDIGHLQKGQHGLVTVVGQKLSPLGYTLRVDRVFLDNPRGAERYCGSEDQRKEKIITA